MKSIRAGWIAVALALLLGGCGGGGGNSNFADGYYRFLQLSPGTGPVAITANGNSIVSSLSYHAASPYVQLGWGTPTIKVQSVSDGTVYVSGMVPVAGAAHYSYFVFGTGSAVYGLPMRDDVGDAASGYFNLAGVHVATGTAAVDVYVLPPGTALTGKTPVFTGLAYATSTAFTQIVAGTYDIIVTPTGTTDVIYDSGAQAFASNRKTSFAIYATGSGKLVNAALLLDDGSGTVTFVDNPAARSKFVAATTDVAAIDVLIDGAPVVSNAPYGSVSAYAALAAGVRNLKVEASSVPGSYLYDQPQAFAGGTDSSLVAYSVQGTGGVGVFALQDSNFPPTSGKASLRIVNAGSDSTAYDAYVNSTKVVSAIAPGRASAYQALDAATYALSFDPAGTTNVAATQSAVLAAGHVYTVYVYGRSGSAATVLTTDF